MKTTNRTQNTPSAIPNREGMEALVGEIAALKNRLRLLTAAMDEQLHSVRAGYEEQLAAHNEALDRKMERARLWAEANPREFGSARSIETRHGTLGWPRQPALKTLAGWTWDRVRDTLKLSGAADYLRVKEEVNKQNLLADRDVMGAAKLRDIGLRVVREESFFVEPRLSEVPDAAR